MNVMTVIYNKIAIIGMGLIGASIALASRRAGLATVMAAMMLTQRLLQMLPHCSVTR